MKNSQNMDKQIMLKMKPKKKKKKKALEKCSPHKTRS